VDLPHVGLAGVDADLLQDGHHGAAEGFEGRLRLPNVHDAETTRVLERNMVEASLRGALTGGLQAADGLVVLSAGHGRRREDHRDGHDISSRVLKPASVG
jgi:hypothetical protein